MNTNVEIKVYKALVLTSTMTYDNFYFLCENEPVCEFVKNALDKWLKIENDEIRGGFLDTIISIDGVIYFNDCTNDVEKHKWVGGLMDYDILVDTATDNSYFINDIKYRSERF